MQELVAIMLASGRTALDLALYLLLPVMVILLAMMGVTLELIKQGTMTMAEFNRLAGFLITPLDMVGVSVLSAAGPRVAAIARPAVIGGLVGILVRGILHLLVF